MRNPNTECSKCGTAFYKRPSQLVIHTEHYCCMDCFRQATARKSKICEGCGVEYYSKSYRGIQKFCSIQCSNRNRAPRSSYGDEVTEETCVLGDKARKRLTTERDGYQCSLCGVDSWSGEKLTLQLDHIDGDRLNNIMSNFRLLCPNCHSQTPTFCRGKINA